MENFRKTPRKKLWEIKELYHCSVAGTCLSLEETKKIFRKAKILLPVPVRDYEIHGAAVNASASKNEISKLMNSFIETKYSYFVSLFGKAEDEESVMKLWDSFLEQGKAAGAYWALMTHPSVSQRNLDRAFGDIHMLSHLNGSETRANIRENDELIRKNKILNEANEELKLKISVMKQEKKTAEESDKLILKLRKDLSAADEEIRILKEGYEVRSLRDEINRLIARCSDFSEVNERLADAGKTADEIIRKLTDEIGMLREEAARKDEEILSIENNLFYLLHGEGRACSGCETDEQNRIDLCGKCILYVGGKPSVVSRCREMVELCGGKFIHHDGGKEENLSRLPAILHRADMIFCPLDCVSHNACLSVKRMSLRHSKPFMLLKSSGLSTFIKGVSDINRPENIDLFSDIPE